MEIFINSGDSGVNYAAPVSDNSLNSVGNGVKMLQSRPVLTTNIFSGSETIRPREAFSLMIPLRSFSR